MLDKYKPPMNLAESERLLKGAADQESAKNSWYMVGLALLLLVCIGVVVGSLIWGFKTAPMSTALVIFLFLLPYFLIKK